MDSIPLYRFKAPNGDEFAMLLEQAKNSEIPRDQYEEMEFEPEYAKLVTIEVYRATCSDPRILH